MKSGKSKCWDYSAGATLKNYHFLLGFVVGFGATAIALLVWTVSLLTVLDWFRGDNHFFSRFPSPIPLWLAGFFTLAGPLLTLGLALYLWKKRSR
jgi:hypothetical protein